MRVSQIPGLYVASSELGGRGVFSISQINSGDLIETCPVIILGAEDLELIHKTLLHDYYFIWDNKKKTGAIALGFGSIYNHSSFPNAAFTIDKLNPSINFHALKNIGIGEEITTCYLEQSDPEYDLWFKPK